jgi:hypothetical protein
MVSPVVLDLNGDGIQTLDIQQGVMFDIDNDGLVEKTAWIHSSDGLLVRDINRDGIINNGGELFGSGTLLPNGSRATDGYMAMRSLDSNLDGLLDANDQFFAEIMVWRDIDSDAKTDAQELIDLRQMGISSISLHANTTSIINNGNFVGLMGSYTAADGTVRAMGDVWFQVDEQGQRVFDLATIATAAGSSFIDLTQGEADTLNVTLADVLAVGEMDVLNGQIQVTITGDASDQVHLEGGSGWSLSGTTTDGADTYMVYVSQNAQLLVNDRIQTVIG